MTSDCSAEDTRRHPVKTEFKTRTFMSDYRYKGCGPGVKEQVAGMDINGSGIRNPARVLNINKNTVLAL